MIERMAVAFHRVYKGRTARGAWILKAYQPEFNKENPLLKIDNRNAGIILLLHSVAFLKNIRRFEMRFMNEVSNVCIYLYYQVGIRKENQNLSRSERVNQINKWKLSLEHFDREKLILWAFESLNQSWTNFPTLFCFKKKCSIETNIFCH